jgi:peptide-methionine (S)-S-oxide reductase
MTRIAALLVALVAIAGGAVLLVAEPAPQPNSEAAAVPQEGLETATFASGCFWCTESDFDKVDGVKETISGYMGGKTENPTYAQVSRGDTGHAEALQLKFDPKVVSYDKLLDYYWRHVDLLDGGGQFCDRGSQYRPVIFAATPEQRKLAEASKAALEKSGRFKEPIAVEIADTGPFTAAEDYHQNYYKTHPIQYAYYRHACGRDARLKRLWGDEADSATH